MQIDAAYSSLTHTNAQKSKTADIGATANSKAVGTTTSTSNVQQQVTAFEQRTGIRGLDQVGFDLSGLLSSNTRTQLNQQQEIQPNDGKPHQITTGREWLANKANELNSASDSTLASLRATSTPLTNDDLAFIKKASGLNVIMGSNGAMELSDGNGNLNTDVSLARGVSQMVCQMEMDRQMGTLTGPITKDYIEGLFARAKEAGSAFDDAFQQKVLSQFAGTDQSKSASESKDNSQKATNASG